MILEHKHLIIRAEVSDCPKEKDLHKVLAWMNELIDVIDMKLLHGPSISYVDQEGNRGITCMALIETSHVVLHIWDVVRVLISNQQYPSLKNLLKQSNFLINF
jgi:S-adenosylmethionine/arginine decarboxylase-like enzyme